jgi:hypothetical protein
MKILKFDFQFIINDKKIYSEENSNRDKYVLLVL